MWKQAKREKYMAVNEAGRSWRSEDHFDIRHRDAEFGVCLGIFLSCFGDQVCDWMTIRRDFELWSFKIVETAIDNGEF